MEANTKEAFKAYCTRWELAYVETPDLDPEEWDETTAVGFHDDPSLCAPAVRLDDDGLVWAVTRFADGRRRLEDTWCVFTESDLTSGERIHAV